MSVHKSDVAFSVFCGKLVVTGGCIRDQRQVKHLTNTVEVYDHFSNSWSPMPPMLEQKCSHDSVSIGSKLYVISNRSSSEVFDYFSNVFARIQKRMPRSGWFWSNVKCLSIGNKIVAFSSNHLYKYAEFDVEKQEWSEVDDQKWSRMVEGRRSRMVGKEEDLQFWYSCIKSPMY